MGCNYYINTNIVSEETIQVVAGALGFTGGRTHIGKCSAAGLYCWDCRQTLCADGEKRIHSGRSSWLNKCPSCSKQAKNKVDGTSGVYYASSFTWAMPPVMLMMLLAPNGLDVNCIEDEYGHKLTTREFHRVLIDSPIQFFNSIGTEFS